LQHKNEIRGETRGEAFLHDLSWVPPLRNETLMHIFNGFTFLGYLPFFLLFLPMGYWLGDKGTFTRLTMLVGFSQLGGALAQSGMERTHILIVQMAYMALVATLVVPAKFRAVGLSSPGGKS
jgi:hypothetical protein